MTSPANHRAPIRELLTLPQAPTPKIIIETVLPRGQGKKTSPPKREPHARLPATPPSTREPPDLPIDAMATLANASRVGLRGMTRTSALATLPVRALSTSAARQDASSPSSYAGTFQGSDRANRVPDWGHYKSDKATTTNQLFGYFMVGSMGAISAAGAKSTVEGTWRDAIPNGAPPSTGSGQLMPGHIGVCD